MKRIFSGTWHCTNSKALIPFSKRESAGGTVMGYTGLGKRLKELRENHQYTQRYVSYKVNIERPSYSNYELGKRTPPLELIIQLADFYHVSLDYLLRSPDSSPGQNGEKIRIKSPDKNEQYLLTLFRLLSEKEKRDVLKYLEKKSGKSDPKHRETEQLSRS